jgi:molybdopterin-containing oxidoreductase family membrane subunit
MFARKSRVSLGLAGLSIVFGIVAVRWNIIVPGLMIPKLAGFSDFFFSPRFTTSYSPSAVEWLSSIGLLSLFMVLISLGLKFLPLQVTAEQASKTEGGH